MKKARKYVVKKLFEGTPRREDFDIVECDLPKIKNGEVLVKVEWVSVDSYVKEYQALYNPKVPYDQLGFQVAIVQESKDPRYPAGSRIVSYKGWCEYCVLSTANISENNGDKIYKLPNLKNLSPSLALGVVGMPGAAAYFGLLEICNPKPGETVVVTEAAGAIGSIVGQIAKIKGCRVIGFTDSTEKVNWLKEIGFDFAYNRDLIDVNITIKQSAPKGVDVYFDNVGGEISSSIINQMNIDGRVAVCGSKILHSDSDKPPATIIQPSLVTNQIRIEGFSAFRWFDRWPDAFAQITKWIASGQLKYREQVFEGFENIYDALIEELQGVKIGKGVVKIS